MEITEVRLKLAEDDHVEDARLRAFASIVLDECFVVRDLKIIHKNEELLVCMPDRRLTDKCPKCGTNNHLRANFCNACGVQLTRPCAGKIQEQTRGLFFTDIAHPINAGCRKMINQAVLRTYHQQDASHHAPQGPL